MTVAHSTLTGSDLHECKGAASATTGQVPVATGSGTAVFSTLAYTQISGTPSLSTVATTGAYSDLSGKPLIPAVYSDSTVTPSTPLIKTYTVTASSGIWTATFSGFTAVHNVLVQAVNAGTTVDALAVAGLASYSTTSATGSVGLLTSPTALGTSQTVIVTVIGY